MAEQIQRVLRIKSLKLLLAVGLFLAAGLLFSNHLAYAANPTTISFQGKVVNADGTNVANNTYTFVFKLYTAGSGGSPIWTETDSSVTVTSGVFQVNLGAGCPFFTSNACNGSTPIDFNANPNLYMGITFNGDAAGEMSPRVQFQSVPYAFNADKLGGIAASGFVQLGATQSGSINITGGTFTGTLAVQGASALTLGTASTASGAILLKSIGGANTVTLQAPDTNPVASYTLKLPTTAPALSQCLQNDGSTIGQLTFGACGSGSGVTTIGTIDSQTKSANGAVISGTSLVLQSADASFPGLVTTGTQTLAGAKTFTSLLAASAGLTVTGGTANINATGAGATNIGSTGTGGAVAIQSASTIALTSGTTLGLTSTGSNNINITPGGGTNTGVLLKPTADSTSAFQIQNAAAASFFTADSTNKIITTLDQNVGSAANIGGAGRLFSDGFEGGSYALWSSSPTTTGTTAVDTAHVRNGKYSAKFTTATSASLITNINASSTVYARAQVYATDNTSNSAALLSFTSGNQGGYWAGLWRDAIGNLCLYYNHGGTFTCSSTVMPLNQWAELEVKVVASSTGSGSLIGYLNGTQFATLTSANTTVATFNNFFIGDSTVSQGNYWVDDVAVDTVDPGASASLNVADSLHVAGTSSFGGNALFQPASNSTTAFQVQNAASGSIINIDTTGANQNNLVTNPSFEGNSTTGWTGDGGTPCTLSAVTSGTTAPFNGVYSGQCAATLAGQGFKFVTGNSPGLSSNAPYTLDFDAKVSGTPGTVLNFGHVENGGGEDAAGLSLTSQTVLSNGWTHYSLTFKTGAAAAQAADYLYIKQNDATTRSLWVDGVTLQTDANADNNYREGKLAIGGVITSPLILQNAANSTTALQVENASGAAVLTVDTTDTNLMGNPGAEVNATGWAGKGTNGTIIRDTSQQKFGYASFKLTGTAANDGAQYTFPTSLPGNGAIAYQIGISVKTNAAFTANSLVFGFVVSAADVNCSSIAPVVSATIPSTTGWTRFTCNITPAAAATGFYVKQTDATSHAGGYWIDGIEIDSGATLSPYGVGSINLNGIIKTPLTLQNQSDSTNALTLYNNAGRALLQVDTLNSQVAITGVAPASASGVAGTTPVNTFSLTGAAGGAVTSGAFTGGNGGGLSLTSGAGGASFSTAANSNGGAITLQGGAAGSGGSGAAGAIGVINLNTSGGNVSIGTATTGTNTLQIGSTALSSGTQTIGIGNTNTAGGTTNIAIGCGATCTGGTTAVTSKGALTITGGAASTWSTSAGLLTITGTGGTTITGNTGVLTVGNTALTGLGLNLLSTTYAAATRGVTIGTADANITLLDLDQSTTAAAETGANCTTAFNPGGLYFATGANTNAGTNGIRGCINGKFQDVISADQLGVLLVGVVPDSGANPGDMSNTSTGPCKTAWTSATTVTVATCVAYSGGRKVTLTAATVVTMPGTTVGQFVHVCFTNGGTAGTPVSLTASAAGTETANVPAFSATNPILCIADVKASGTNTIGNIYDTRVFTNTTKQFTTMGSATAVSAGMIVIINGTNGVNTVAGAQTAAVRGIVAIGNSTGSTGSQIIVATGGPAFAKSTGVITAGQAAQTSGTAGYIQSAASVGGYKDMGQIIDTVSTACTSAADCQFSTLVDLGAH